MNKQIRQWLVAAFGVAVLIGLVLTSVGTAPELDAARQPTASATDLPLRSAARAALPQPDASSPVMLAAAPESVVGSVASAGGLRVSVPVDWGRYPGTLQTQIQQALQTLDGAMAADLARKLRECDLTTRLMQPQAIARLVSAGGDPALEAARDAQFQTYQRIFANCQTVVGDPAQLQLALLDVAVAHGVVGAAVESFNLGQRKPEVLQGVKRDAVAGHVFSLIPVTSHKASLFGISLEQQRSLRLAFEIAANDPEVGTLIRPYLGVAEARAGFSAGKLGFRFNQDGLTDAMRHQAQLMAQQIVERVKVPKPDVTVAR